MNETMNQHQSHLQGLQDSGGVFCRGDCRLNGGEILNGFLGDASSFYFLKNIRNHLFLVVLFLLLFNSYSVYSQGDNNKTIINYNINIGDTIFIRNPILIEGLKESIVLTNVDKIDQVLAIFKSNNADKGFKKIKKDFAYKNYIHYSKMNTLFKNYQDSRRVHFYDSIPNEVFEYNGVVVKVLKPCYMIEFYFSNKKQNEYQFNYHLEFQNKFKYNAKTDANKYTEYGILFSSMDVVQIENQQQKRLRRVYYFGDTLFVKVPIVLYGPNTRIVFTNVDDVKNVIAVFKHISSNRAITKLKGKFAFKKYISNSVITFINKDDPRIKNAFIETNPKLIMEYKYKKIRIEVYDSCYMKEFSLSKKTISQTVSSGHFNPKKDRGRYNDYLLF